MEGKTAKKRSSNSSARDAKTTQDAAPAPTTPEDSADDNGVFREDGASMSLGTRLSALRRERGQSLVDVAEATGISASFVSLVERNKSNITITRLLRLAQHYGVRVSDLLDDDGTSEPWIMRRNQQQHLDSSGEGIQVYLLAPPHKAMMPVVSTFEQGASMAGTQRHQGDEWIWVVEGAIEVQVDGVDPFVLKAGDAAYYTGERAHSFRNVGPGRARLLGVVTPPNW
jgi:transcriptional regulator with XRE-family HTH domain